MPYDQLRHYCCYVLSKCLPYRINVSANGPIICDKMYVEFCHLLNSKSTNIPSDQKRQ